MDLMKHLTKGWSITLNFLGPVLLLTVVQVLVTLLSLGILGPVTFAGYCQSLLQGIRDGRPPEIRDLFSQMSLFFPLFGFGLLVFIVTTIGIMLFILPGLIVIGCTIFACLYLMPLMTDRRLGLIEAVKCSWQMALQNPVADHVIILIVYVVVLSIGSSIPFLILIAQPLATFILLSVYEERLADRLKLLEDGKKEEFTEKE